MNVEQQSIYDNDIANTQRLSGKKWAIIEKPLDERDSKINQMIMLYGERSAIQSEEINMLSSNLIILGEIYYKQVREKLEKDNILILKGHTKLENKTKEEIKLEKEKNAKIEKELKKSSNKVRLESISTKLFDQLEFLIEILNGSMKVDEYNNNINKCKEYLEFKIIILMKMINNIIKIKISETNTKKNQSIDSQIDEIILGSKKILFSLKQNKEINNYKKICSIEHVEFNICDLLINDLECCINDLLVLGEIELYNIANRNPRLIYETIYDNTLPNQRLKLHDSQKEVLNKVKDNIDNGFMILYKTLPGLGKTSMVTGICSYIKDLNSIDKSRKKICKKNKKSITEDNDKKKVRVIFCCSDILESVRMQVLRIAYYFKIKFGVAITNKSRDDYKIVNSWNCPNDDVRELIAADYVSTSLMLKEANEKNNIEYLLFFDEPTFLTDNENNRLSLKYLSEILYYLPKRTILSSATLPDRNELDLIVDDFKEKYPDSNIIEVISNKTLTGCFIKDFNSNIIVPHIYCKNIVDLDELVNKIRKFPSIGKFYTLPFLLNFNKYCKSININLNFDDVENFEHDNILENILVLFNKFIDYVKNLDSQEEQEQVFNSFINIQVTEINENNFNSLIKNETDYNKVCFDKLLTKHAYKYIGCCLIADDSPVEFAERHLYDMVEKLKKKMKIESINKVYLAYKNENAKYQAKIDEIESKCKSEEKQDERLNKMKQPKFLFNRALEINTSKHISSFAKYVDQYDTNLLKGEIVYEEVDITEYKISDNIKFLLLMGVGLYSKSLDSEYTSKVIELLEKKQLAYIIADESFTHGVNYPITNIIVTDDFSDNHGINTLLQLIGRTSRIGKSWSGKVYLDDKTTNKIITYFSKSNNYNEERENIINSYEEQKRKIRIENNKKQTKKEVVKKTKPIKLSFSSDSLSSIIKPKNTTSLKEIKSENNLEKIIQNENSSSIKDLRKKLLETNVIDNDSDSDEEYSNNRRRENRRNDYDRWGSDIRNKDTENRDKYYEHRNDRYRENNEDNNKWGDIRNSNNENNKEERQRTERNNNFSKWDNIKKDEFDFINSIQVDKKEINETNETNKINEIKEIKNDDSKQLDKSNKSKTKFNKNKKQTKTNNPFM